MARNIQEAWAKSGLFPLNPAVILARLLKSRPITPPDNIILDSSTGYSATVLYISVNVKEINTFVTRMADQEA